MTNKESIWSRLFSNDYKLINAVDDITFAIKRGEIVGFIGPNGAGKSTTIKMMSGILVPTTGHLEVLGKEPHKFRKENAKSIGVVFGQRTQLWWDLPLSDTFKLLKNMYRIPDEVYKRNLETFMTDLDIKSFIDQPVRQLSLGQRMRGEIAAAMLHDPDILFLDEPTIGLDIVAKKQMRNFIQRINQKRQVTIILTTHDMKDIENLCNRIILINGGKIILDMPLAEVKEKFNTTHDIKITFATHPMDLIEENGCEVIKQGDMDYLFRIQKDKIKVNEFVSSCMARYDIQDISIQGTDIEEIIRQLY